MLLLLTLIVLAVSIIYPPNQANAFLPLLAAVPVVTIGQALMVAAVIGIGVWAVYKTADHWQTIGGIASNINEYWNTEMTVGEKQQWETQASTMDFTKHNHLTVTPTMEATMRKYISQNLSVVSATTPAFPTSKRMPVSNPNNEQIEENAFLFGVFASTVPNESGQVYANRKFALIRQQTDSDSTFSIYMYVINDLGNYQNRASAQSVPIEINYNYQVGMEKTYRSYKRSLTLPARERWKIQTVFGNQIITNETFKQMIMLDIYNKMIPYIKDATFAGNKTVVAESVVAAPWVEDLFTGKTKQKTEDRILPKGKVRDIPIPPGVITKDTPAPGQATVTVDEVGATEMANGIESTAGTAEGVGVGDIVISFPDVITVSPDMSQSRPAGDEIGRWTGLVTTKFPFSLPWDVLHLIGLVNVPAKRPEISVDQNLGTVPIRFNVGFEWMDPYIGYFRTFIVIGFCWSLVLMTRRLLGGAS